MPWSDWQDPLTVSAGGPKFRQGAFYRTVAGNHATYDKFTAAAVYGSHFIFEHKPTAAPQYHSQGMMQYRAPRNWSVVRPVLPAPLNPLTVNLDYAQRPDRAADAHDKFVEYEAGPNTLIWPGIRADGTSSGYTGPVRLMVAPSALIPETDGDYAKSFGEAILAAGTLIATYQAPYAGVLGLLPIPDNTGGDFVLYVETDAATGSGAYVPLTLNFTTPNVITPRWRYWIPESVSGALTVPTPRSGVARSIMIDCSGAAPQVVSHQEVRANLDPYDYAPNSLRLDSLGRVVACTSTTFTVLSQTTGQVIAELFLDDRDSYLPIGIFSKPDDLTQCAVVYNSGNIFVVQDLDTDSPSVLALVTYVPKTAGWHLFSTDPYRESHGIFEGNFEHVQDGDVATALPFRPINPPGPDTSYGEVTSWPFDSAGYSKMGPGRAAFAYIGGNELTADTDQAMTMAVADYRNGIGDVKTLKYFPQSVVPDYVEGDSWLDWLLAGSFSLAASGEHGVVLAGFTTLTNHMSSVAVPGQDLYYNRYSVVASVGRVGGSPDETSGGNVLPLHLGGYQDQDVTLGVTAPTFYEKWVDGIASPAVAPDANHIVVGAADLASLDDSTYLEFTQNVGVNNDYREDSIGGPLAPLVIPEGLFASGQFSLEVRFNSTDWAVGVAYYNYDWWIVALTDDGRLDWGSSVMARPGEVVKEPLNVWRHHIVEGTLTPALISKMVEGKAAVVFFPDGYGSAGASLKVSSLKAHVTLRSLSV